MSPGLFAAGVREYGFEVLIEYRCSRGGVLEYAAHDEPGGVLLR
jgi:hypothetical protein